MTAPPERGDPNGRCHAERSMDKKYQELARMKDNVVVEEEKVER